MGRTPKERSKYIIFIEGTSVEVTREVYRAYYSGNRAERYQAELDQHYGLLHMSEMEDQLVDADKRLHAWCKNHYRSVDKRMRPIKN